MRKLLYFTLLLFSILTLSACNKNSITGPKSFTIKVDDIVELDLNKEIEKLDFEGLSDLISISGESSVKVSGLKPGSGTLKVILKDNPKIFLEIAYTVTALEDINVNVIHETVSFKKITVHVIYNETDSVKQSEILNDVARQTYLKHETLIEYEKYSLTIKLYASETDYESSTLLIEKTFVINESKDNPGLNIE